MTTNHSRNRNYANSLNIFNAAYKDYPVFGEGCVYCGVMADTIDHVPPLSAVHALGWKHFHATGIRLYRVPACRECNMLLVQSGGMTVEERKKHIKRKLKLRYGKFLRGVHWTKEEISELGSTLRDKIEDGCAIKEWVKKRLAW